MDWAYTLSGFAVGGLIGLTGVGGGSLMTPLLVLLFGFAPVTAVGTDLLFASITKMGGVWVHSRRGTIDWKVVGLLASGSIPASLLTLVLLNYMDARQANALIVPLMGVALLLTALALVFKAQLLRFSKQKETLHISWRTRALNPMTIALGATLGFLVTLTSIGAGALGVVALFLLYPLIPTAKIVGTDIAHAVPLTLVAGLGHVHMGNVDFLLLGSLLLGSLPGIYLGSHLSVKIPERILRFVLASMLVLIGIKFVAS
ncbi:MAG TPA: sulfite exporter TauE/SafE family protein [Gammaproteobacteria bacterium]|nr:sulfite exporter TauE/SafE family protein [Gammaproteobacteria bacterium]